MLVYLNKDMKTHFFWREYIQLLASDLHTQNLSFFWGCLGQVFFPVIVVIFIIFLDVWIISHYGVQINP